MGFMQFRQKLGHKFTEKQGFLCCFVYCCRIKGDATLVSTCFTFTFQLKLDEV